MNINAVRIMGELHDALEEGGYTGHALERLLVRILFCLFAEDSGIFDEPQAFRFYIEDHTRPDGSDLGAQLALFFQTLNEPPDRRQANLLEELQHLPWVNGDLFGEPLQFAAFNRSMREKLIAATNFRWSRISPAIFGALFQSVMEPRERRQIGAHYTSERDILKVIGPLFLDDLNQELVRAGRDRTRLQHLHQRLANIRLLDPACGCGNFLVVSYRELRLIEHEILVRLLRNQQVADIGAVQRLDVSQMYGIEIEEWPARIAEVAMWLVDHQMNQLLGLQLGNYFKRLPLRTSPHIRHGNALQTDWNDLLPAEACTHVLGNPPFVGKKERSREQQADHRHVWGDVRGTGVLDYVTCWYRKAAQYVQETDTTIAFVSTNSISQGEQVAILWEPLERQYNLQLFFAHRTFAWKSEARGSAHVHCVIEGLSRNVQGRRRLFEYDRPTGDPHEVECPNINAYLAPAVNVLVKKRRAPLNGAPAISYGSMMIDKPRAAGDEEGLILTPAHRTELLDACPYLEPYIRRLYGGKEYINGIERWCLWLVDAPPQLIRGCASLRRRIENIRRFRLSSTRAQTRRLADTPHLFGEIRQPDTTYLLIPKVSSVNRRYIPIGFLSQECIASGSALIVPRASNYDFGILSSAMHHAWMTYVAGRFKSDYQYSSEIVYNNFPWPNAISDERRNAIAAAAQQVLDARGIHANSTLADLYDPLFTPEDLLAAHRRLDQAVDRAYRNPPFPHDRNRVEHLFAMFAELNQPLLPPAGRRRRG